MFGLKTQKQLFCREQFNSPLSLGSVPTMTGNMLGPSIVVRASSTTKISRIGIVSKAQKSKGQ